MAALDFRQCGFKGGYDLVKLAIKAIIEIASAKLAKSPKRGLIDMVRIVAPSIVHPILELGRIDFGRNYPQSMVVGFADH
jgi:hypothetical protein